MNPLTCSIVLTVLTVQSIRAARLGHDVQEALVAETRRIEGLTLDTWHVIERGGPVLCLDVQVWAVRSS